MDVFPIERDCMWIPTVCWNATMDVVFQLINCGLNCKRSLSELIQSAAMGCIHLAFHNYNALMGVAFVQLRMASVHSSK